MSCRTCGQEVIKTKNKEKDIDTRLMRLELDKEYRQEYSKVRQQYRRPYGYTPYRFNYHPSFIIIPVLVLVLFLIQSNQNHTLLILVAAGTGLLFLVGLLDVKLNGI